MKKKGLILLSLFMCFTGAAQTGVTGTDENEFTMGVQIRPRTEYRNGALFPRSAGEEAAGFINNRSRLSLGYKREKLSIGLSAQHVGVWGQDPQIDKNGRFVLNEAWANLNLGNGFFMKLGRQSLVYDDERILGALDWNVAGRYHDAFKLGYEDISNKLHLVLAFNQNDEYIIGGTYYAPVAQPYKNMQTLWYQYLAEKNFKASFLVMNLGLEAGDYEERKSDTKYMQTFGTNLNYSQDGFDVNGIFYYQTGKNKSDQKVSAYMWGVNAGYQLDPQWKVIAGIENLSGDNRDSDKFQAFDPLYGTHHKFYGSMDYFYASSFVGGYNPGLWDSYLGFTFKPSPKVNLSLTYHYFATAADVYAVNEKVGKGLGSELDFQIDWNIMKDVRLSGGYSTMLGTNTMKVVKGGNPSHWQDWAWVSININPTIFIAKW